MSEAIIRVKNVTKAFQEGIVLNDVSISFKRGKIHGIVGRNGSGKTMLFKCICGFIQISSGEITVDGKKIGVDTDIPNNIGIIIEEPGFLPNYSGYANLRLLASINSQLSKTEIFATMRKVGLDPNNRKHIKKYSMGMRQRLGIAQAIMENPEILIFDEPMNGLDNIGVNEIRGIFKKLRNEGKTILLASHNSEDINELCDTVINMDNGRITSITSKD
jgi:ABC-2 type transport system ATP-binding protein